ncbi:MAG: hypothetical protein CUN57_00075 [Phototrophicales bacterium]|nr:MAG: hypothetical protein CUN57_00075 [Phototrophicales bacterium]
MNFEYTNEAHDMMAALIVNENQREAFNQQVTNHLDNLQVENVPPLNNPGQFNINFGQNQYRIRFLRVQQNLIRVTGVELHNPNNVNVFGEHPNN